MVNIDEFEKQIDNVEYKGEIYSIRDNGSVMRHPKNEKSRPLDNKWSFGKQNIKTGYMEVGGERVHRIIATGFLGKAPSNEHLVDHIDTNRANNRPENLRWVTKFENAILNPITAKKISMVCGSVEEFLKDPSKYRVCFNDPNVSWMCAVSKEEAQNCLENLKNWARREIKTTKPVGKLGDWVFKPQTSRGNYTKSFTENYIDNTEEERLDSVNNEFYTPNTKQDWSTPTRFPSCPQVLTKNALEEYFKNLVEGSIFGENKYTHYIVVKSALCKDKIVVLTEDQAEHPIKPWCVTQITFENNIFYHSVVKTCFSYIGAEKHFTVEQGLEWTGEDSIDDYC